MRQHGLEIGVNLQPLVEISEALREQISALDRQMRDIASNNPTCRNFQTIPGVGAVIALSFYSAIGDPHRFERSRDVGAYLGLTPTLYQSGVTSRRGRILIGDVFLASGQSNMHWPVQKSDVKKYPHTKYNDRIRLLKMHYLRARAPEGYTDKELARSNSDDFFQGSWERADLKEISDFSAVAWTAGSLIANDQDVPIGLVQVAVGGSALNNWIPQRVLRTHPFTRHIFKGDFFTNPYFLKPHKERGKQALQRAMSPNEPFIIGKSKYRWMCEPSFLFDAGIAPLKHAGLKAVLWYQGESDATRVEHTVHYRELFPRMVESWRENFRDPNLPFFVIQLPGYDSPYWPALREAQSMAVDQMSNASLIVTYDLGEKKNIHPSDKREVGERLAAAVLANVYGVGGLPVYPGIFEISGEGSELEIRLSNFKSGKPGKSIEGFEIGNEYGRYAPAEAKFTSSDTLLVSSKIDGPVPRQHQWHRFEVVI